MPWREPFLLFALGDTPSLGGGKGWGGWPQADLCPWFLAGHPQMGWEALALNLSLSLFTLLPPPHPHQLSAQPVKTNLGGGDGWAACSFPVQLPSWGRGASCHLLAKCCLRQLSPPALGPELSFPGQELGFSGVRYPQDSASPLRWGCLRTGLVRARGCPR